MCEMSRQLPSRQALFEALDTICVSHWAYLGSWVWQECEAMQWPRFRIAPGSYHETQAIETGELPDLQL